MFWKSYFRSKTFLYLFSICFCAAILVEIVIILFNLPIDSQPKIIAILSTTPVALIVYGILFIVFTLSYKQQYEYLTPKYYIMHGKYYFTGCVNTETGELTFTDNKDDAELYISMRKINTLLEAFKTDYNIPLEKITVNQLNFKEAYNALIKNRDHNKKEEK